MADDYLGNANTTGVVPIDGTSSGWLDYNDKDWFKVTLTAGQGYVFRVEAYSNSQGSLYDPILTLYDANTNTLATDDNTGIGQNAQLSFVAPTSGTYYLGVKSASPDYDAGSYVVGASKLNDVVGNNGDNMLNGGSGRDLILGKSGNDTLKGLGGNDYLEGGPGNDRLVGGAGRDILRGGLDADTFDFNATSESTAADPDLILDFNPLAGDKIDLATIDARASQSGNQTFAFIGYGEFTTAGQVRQDYDYNYNVNVIKVNTDSDLDPEMVIRYDTDYVYTLYGADFIL